MHRLLAIPTLAVVTSLIAGVQPAGGCVVTSVLPKGEVPERHCTKLLAAALKHVPPIRGETIDSFSRFSCTLYYRGTHNHVQKLLDGLAKVESLNSVLKIDRSGKIGILVSRQTFPMQRTVPYSYCVSISWQQLVELRTVTPSPQPSIVTVTIFSASGIEPKKLEIPAGMRIVEKAESSTR